MLLEFVFRVRVNELREGLLQGGPPGGLDGLDKTEPLVLGIADEARAGILSECVALGVEDEFVVGVICLTALGRCFEAPYVVVVTGVAEGPKYVGCILLPF